MGLELEMSRPNHELNLVKNLFALEPRLRELATQNYNVLEKGNKGNSCMEQRKRENTVNDGNKSYNHWKEQQNSVCLQSHSFY